MKIDTVNETFLKNVKKITGIHFLDANKLRVFLIGIAKEEINKNMDLNFINKYIGSIIDYNSDRSSISMGNIFRDFKYINDNFIKKNIENIKNNVEYEKYYYDEKTHINAFKIYIIESLFENLKTENTRSNDRIHGNILAYFAHYCKGYSQIINKRNNGLADSTYKTNKIVIDTKCLDKIIISDKIKNNIINQLILDFRKDSGDIYNYQIRNLIEKIDRIACIKKLKEIKNTNFE